MTFFVWSNLKPILEILILWVVFYRILVFFEGTRALQVLKGIGYLIVAFLISQILGLDTLNWLLTRFFAISIVAFLIIFQPELRQGLARLGQQHLFGVDLAESEIMAIIEEITTATYRLSNQKIGCLIAIEREAKLKPTIESGIQMDSKVSAELIQSIFSLQSPLHDGGMIIRGERIVAASCLFPLSENVNLNKTVGTRHRAALGLTEQTDSLVVMVSERTGDVSLAVNGRLIAMPNEEKLISQLKDLLVKRKNKRV